jgi:hypothetical protein
MVITHNGMDSVKVTGDTVQGLVLMLDKLLKIRFGESNNRTCIRQLQAACSQPPGHVDTAATTQHLSVLMLVAEMDMTSQ